MKVVILSAVLFALIVFGVVANALYSSATLTHLEELATEAYKNSASSEALSAVIDYWDKKKDYFAVTASTHDIDSITENLLCMQVALQSGNDFAAKQSYALLCNSIEAISRYERISFSNIF